MSSPTLRLLLASPDRCLLRHLARFLRTFGYETCAISDPLNPDLQLVFDPPDILILDNNFQKDDPWSLCREIRRGLAGREMQTVALCQENLLADFVAPLEAGVDEFLMIPIDYGELLTRLRSCARRLEFERRLREQSGVNPQTGLLISERFWEKLQQVCSSGSSKIVCMMFGVDRFSDFVLRYGTQAAEMIEHIWAGWLSATAPPGAILGDLGKGRFGGCLA